MSVNVQHLSSRILTHKIKACLIPDHSGQLGVFLQEGAAVFTGHPFPVADGAIDRISTGEAPSMQAASTAEQSPNATTTAEMNFDCIFAA